MLHTWSRCRVAIAPPALLLTLLLAGAPAAYGQSGSATGSVAGRVTDASTQQPLAGAQLFIPGTNQGAVTNADGRYTIPAVAPGTVEVRVRRIAYQIVSQSATVVAGQTATVNFSLSATATTLSEVVITATGEQRRREVGNAVSTVNAARQVELAAPTNVATLLQGNATGVTIQGSSGTVGNAANIKIRGNTSINLSNTPLVYIDGARVNTDARVRGVGGAMSDRLLDINPADIESIEVVKGPAAATLYGTEAAAGVIRVTTKRGSGTAAQFSTRLDYGQRWDPNDYPARAWNAQTELGAAYKDTTYYLEVLKGSANIPDENLYYNPFRTGESKKLAVALRGGANTMGYYTSLDVLDDQGVFVTNGQRAYNLRGNFNLQPRKNITLAVSNGFTTSNTAYNYNDGESWGFLGAVLTSPTMYVPISASDPTTGGAAIMTCPRAVEDARRTASSLATQTTSLCNPDRSFAGSNNFDRLRTMDNHVRLERYVGSATLQHTQGSWLTNRLTAGYDSYSERGWNMIPNVPLKVLDSDPERTVNDAFVRTITVEGASTLNADLPWQLAGNKVNSQTTFGAQYYGTRTQQTTATAVNFPPGAYTIGNGATRDAGELFSEVRTFGFFVQQQFGYADRLFITPAVRFDRNSAFGDNLGTVAYPKVSASWVVNEESWFPKAALDQLRLRGAWGTAGKQPGPFDAVTVLNVTSVTQPNGSSATGFAPSRVGNDDLKPETGRELELGLDLAALSNRMSVEVTYFDKTTKNALVLRALAPSSGFARGRWDNVGEVKNKGVEAAVDATLLRRERLSWNARASYTGLSSKITRLDVPIPVGGRGLQQHIQGYAYGAYFFPRVSLDAAGNVVVGSTSEYFGQPTPTYEGSVSSTLSLFANRVVLYGQLGYSGGNKQVNYTELYMCRRSFRTCTQQYERGEDGQLTDEAKIKGSTASNSQPYPFLYDASFAKLRTLSAQFNVPARFAGRLGARGLTLSVVGNNLGTWTDYPGVDPEINSQGRQNASQREFFSAGQTRSVTFGVGLNY